MREGSTDVSYTDLTGIDIGTLGHLDGDGLRAHFRALAMRASPGQVRSALGMPPGGVDDGPEERAQLADAFADRRTATALGLRGFGNLFRPALRPV